MMMAGSSLSRITGLGEFCMPADGCRGRCAKHKPCRIADRYGCRWKLLTGWSFALYVSFSFLLLHLFCCIRTYGLHCPRPCASFRGYSPQLAYTCSSRATCLPICLNYLWIVPTVAINLLCIILSIIFELET